MLKNVSLFQIALLAIFLFIAGAGLVAFVTFEGGGAEVKSEITIWTDFNNQELVSYLERNVPEGFDSVKVTTFNPATFVTDVISRLSLGQAPDVVLTDSNNQIALGPRLRSIPYESLTESSFRQTFVTGAQSVFATQSGYAGLPFAVDPLLLYVDEQELNELGITTVPRYWDEVSSIVNNYSQRSGPEVEKVIFPLGLARNIEVGDDIFATLLGQIGQQPLQNGPSGIVPGATNDESAQILNYYTDFADLNSGVYNWNANYPSDREVFVSRDALFYIDYASAASRVQNLNPNLALLFAEVPQIRGNNKYVHAKFYGLYFPAATQSPAAINYATAISGDEGIDSLLKNLTLSSASRARITTNEQDPLQAVVARSSLFSGAWPQANQVRAEELFADLIDNVLFRGESYQRALVEYGESLERL